VGFILLNIPITHACESINLILLRKQKKKKKKKINVEASPASPDIDGCAHEAWAGF
jgi:hypothetical protein